MDDTTVLILQDTSQFERFELEQLAPPGVVEITEPTVDPHAHGELLTALALVWLSAEGLRVLATWLNKRREKEKFVTTATLRKPDGSEKEITINWSREASEAASAEQLKALGKLLDVDLPALPA